MRVPICTQSLPYATATLCSPWAAPRTHETLTVRSSSCTSTLLQGRICGAFRCESASTRRPSPRALLDSVGVLVLITASPSLPPHTHHEHVSQTLKLQLAALVKEW